MPGDSKFENITTTQEAIDLVQELISRQLTRASNEKPQPNQSIKGDFDAREAFWLLLDSDTQRRVFLGRCAKTDFWPRIRTLIGSPPFSFLRPEDDTVLQAAGITASRVHMAPTDAFTTYSANEIGWGGHFSDFGGRDYRVVTDGIRHNPEIAPVFVRATTGKRVVLDTKLPRIKTAEKIGIIKASKNTPTLISSIVFPRPGEKIKLSMNKKLGKVETTIEIRSVQQRSKNSPVARIVALVL
tara:strand:+ start:216 stop:941 length:726 start_codon:yes stop_codon:yes gene_type:complete